MLTSQVKKIIIKKIKGWPKPPTCPIGVASHCLIFIIYLFLTWDGGILGKKEVKMVELQKI
jgi:hypothetical protein